MWQVAPESKIQLVSFNLSLGYFLGISALENICVIEAYIFCDQLWYVLFSDILSIFVDLYAHFLGFSVFQWSLLPKVSGFRKFAMKWSSHPFLKHVFGFLTITFSTIIIRVALIEWWFIIALSIFLFLIAFFSWVWTSTVNANWLRKICCLNISYWIVQIERTNLQVRYR